MGYDKKYKLSGDNKISQSLKNELDFFNPVFNTASDKNEHSYHCQQALLIYKVWIPLIL